ncbi:MAG TPA: ABC transporter ATP-binding protein [Steroidobacteraceae bacterium]|nr:ABC transporter ATP-binding protein [Steroidobacteraceae bacterium]
MREAISAFPHALAQRALRRQPGPADASSEEFWALREVSFDVRRGQRLAIIGRNGAGKSTLLKILSRITEPSRGRIVLRGRVASLLEVGTGFHAELTGRENVFLNAAILGMSRAEIRRKFDEIVAFSEVERFLDTPVKRYSSGMTVRLAFAVAAHLEPEILIVDEVLAVGDAAFQRKCLGKMREVAGQGRTILFVSHNMAAVEALCDVGILLTRGRLSFLGDVRSAIGAYAAENSAIAAGTVDLAAHRDRRSGPRQYAQFLRLSVLDAHGQPTGVLRMGERVTFRMEIDVQQARDDYEIGVRIGTLYGIYVHQLVSNWEGFQSIPGPGPCVIDASIERLQLFPGDYQVDVWVKRQGEAHFSDDIVLEALRFAVEETPLTPGPAYFKRYSTNTEVYVPSQWRLIGSAPNV